MSLFWKCIDHFGSFSSLLCSFCASSCDKLACLSHKTFSLTNQIVHYLSAAPIISHAYADAETPLVMQITLVYCKTTWYVYTGKCFLMKVAYKNVCVLLCVVCLLSGSYLILLLDCICTLHSSATPMWSKRSNWTDLPKIEVSHTFSVILTNFKNTDRSFKMLPIILTDEQQQNLVPTGN